MNAFRPLIREASIAFYRWALRDMQRTNPCHPDMPEVIVNLRDLLAERYAARCYIRRVIAWL